METGAPDFLAWEEHDLPTWFRVYMNAGEYGT